MLEQRDTPVQAGGRLRRKRGYDGVLMNGYDEVLVSGYGGQLVVG